MSLEDDLGNTLRTFRHGDGPTFVLGYLGERYRVRLMNHGDRRVEAVVTVDGRDVVSGDPGDYVRERGYIVPPHGSVVVDGFRQSLSRAAAFRFSRPGSSYSSRMGTPENVGVIGVAFFGEQRPPMPRPRPFAPYAPYEKEDWRARRADQAPSAGAGRSASSPEPSREESARAPSRKSAGRGYDDSRYAPPAPERDAPGRLGTEYGESTSSPVSEVPFRRRSPSHPDVVLTLRYDDAQGLVARGFDVYDSGEWPEPYAPDAFPRSHFAAPPP